MIRIENVTPNSLGAELGLQPGTQLVSINGRELHDFLDWEFLSADDQFVLLVEKSGGEAVEYDIERPEALPMGIELEPPAIRRCANRCDFCFVDGNPEGMRAALYIRDDDYRLSFRHGNFATLTNLKQADIDRIIEYRLSPLYVSVHATDPVVRRRLLRNPFAPAILPQLASFITHGIQFHTQIVMQPGVNDGAVLTRSLEDLYSLGPDVLSVSVVPVGLTEFSKHQLVREPTPQECEAAVDATQRIAARAKKERGRHWAYGADDLYLLAGRDLPAAERYDGFDQAENGVGSVRFLQERLKGFRADLSNQRIAVMTGKAMERSMPQVIHPLSEATGATFELNVLVNDLYGPSVTSAGLLPGRSFARALRERTDLDCAILPAESVSERDVFVDDMSVEELRRAVPIDIRFSYHFTDALGSE